MYTMEDGIMEYRIGKAVMPEEVINAFAVLKMAAARVNRG